MDEQLNSTGGEVRSETRVDATVTQATEVKAKIEATEIETPAAETSMAGTSMAGTSMGETSMTPAVTAEEMTPVESSARLISRGESKKSESKKTDRPFRVKLRGSVLVLVRLPNKRDVRAAFHQLSVSGGVVHLEKPLDEKLGVEMIFHIGGATIREKAQMLFPMWATQGWMQPFRFVEMTDASREGLGAHLKSFLGESAKGAAAGA